MRKGQFTDAPRLYSDGVDLRRDKIDITPAPVAEMRRDEAVHGHDLPAHLVCSGEHRNTGIELHERERRVLTGT